MSITLEDIDNAENANKNICVALDAIGREIYLMREDEKLGSEYGFDRYSREQFCGTNYSGQEGPYWGVGTPILSLVYYWPRGENIICVTLPQSYLCCDWRSVEQARIDAERAADAETERKRIKQMVIDLEASERATYKRLKARFEGSTP